MRDRQAALPEGMEADETNARSQIADGTGAATQNIVEGADSPT